jgi:P27 family predicted phage terminase small subunit
MKVLTGDDWATFAGFCQTWARFCELERHMKKAPFEERHDRKAVTTFRDYLMQLRSLGSEFGLTPASRSRLATGSGSDADDFEDFVQLNVVNG